MQVCARSPNPGQDKMADKARVTRRIPECAWPDNVAEKTIFRDYQSKPRDYVQGGAHKFVARPRRSYNMKESGTPCDGTTMICALITSIQTVTNLVQTPHLYRLSEILVWTLGIIAQVVLWHGSPDFSILGKKWGCRGRRRSRQVSSRSVTYLCVSFPEDFLS